LANAQNVLIHVQPFPWNQLLIDGRPVGPGNSRRLASGTIVALTAGKHEITYAWKPAVTWSWLNSISRIGIVLWLSFAFVIQIVPRFSKRRRVRQSPGLDNLETSSVRAPRPV